MPLEPISESGHGLASIGEGDDGPTLVVDQQWKTGSHAEMVATTAALKLQRIYRWRRERLRLRDLYGDRASTCACRIQRWQRPRFAWKPYRGPVDPLVVEWSIGGLLKTLQTEGMDTGSLVGVTNILVKKKKRRKKPNAAMVQQAMTSRAVALGIPAPSNSSRTCSLSRLISFCLAETVGAPGARGTR